MLKKSSVVLVAIIMVSQGAKAQFPLLDIVTTLAKKVIVAIDLQVQRAQTRIIELQAAQQELENAMALDNLTAITGWLQQEKDLYAGYYQELWQIKNAISAYERGALLKAQGDHWVLADRAQNCNDPSIPSAVHFYCTVS